MSSRSVSSTADQPRTLVENPPHASSKKRRGRTSSLLGRLALVLFGLLGPLLLLEAALRLAGPILPGFYRTGTELISHPTLGYFHRPSYVGWRKSPEFTVQIRINSQGLRDREVPYAKPAGVRRVLVLGDSFVEALNVNPDEMVTSRLQALLAGTEPRTEVINAGVGGYGTSQQLLLLQQEGVRYNPDLVVLVFYIGNDVRNNSSELDHESRAGAARYFRFAPDGRLEMIPPPTPESSSDGTAMAMAERFLGGSVLFNVFKTGVLEKLYEGDVGDFDFAVGSNEQVFRVRDNRRWTNAWTLTEALLGAVKNETEGRGARFLLVVAPSDYQVRPDDWEQALKRERLPADDYDLEKPNRRLAEIAARLDVPMIDLLPDLRRAQADQGVELYYPQNRHWTPAAHDLVARVLAERVRQELP